jgi:hypothetical protein
VRDRGFISMLLTGAAAEWWPIETNSASLLQKRYLKADDSQIVQSQSRTCGDPALNVSDGSNCEMLAKSRCFPGCLR